MDARTRWIGGVALAVLLTGLGALAAQPLLAMRADLAAMRDLIEEQRDLLEGQADISGDMLEHQTTLVGVVDEQGRTTDEMFDVVDQQLEVTQAMRGDVGEQAEMVATSANGCRAE